MCLHVGDGGCVYMWVMVDVFTCGCGHKPFLESHLVMEKFWLRVSKFRAICSCEPTVGHSLTHV